MGRRATPRLGGYARGVSARLLLASSSVAALLIGGGAPMAFAASCSPFSFSGVSNSGVSNSDAINCIDIFNSTISGSVVNTATGTINAHGATAPSTTGITINNSTVTGTISNAGLISANNNGIYIDNNATVSGGITNSGSISADGDGIWVGGRVTGSSVAISAFAGGISNGGTISSPAEALAIFVGGTAGYPGHGGGSVTISTFAGGITNSGTISEFSGIVVGGFAEDDGSVAISTFTGGITNSGTVSAIERGILVGGEADTSASVTISTFAGGIANRGNISSSNGNGIVVGGSAYNRGSVTIPSFTGGISNSGTISAGGSGIWVGGTAVGAGANLTISTFAGGITNSGTISAGGNGIFVGGTARSGASVAISTFAGGITNSGAISAAGDGILVNGFVSTFVGNITNSGTISAGGAGILLTSVSAFVGDIASSGTISAGGAGIQVIGVSAFAGGVSNSGTIEAHGSGISLLGISTFSGGIANSGTISVGGPSDRGIYVAQVTQFGTISAGGGISNSGTITANTGIVISVGVTFASGSAIVNTGIITGTGGTAINLLAATSPVTIDINGGAINGNMIGTSGNGDAINFALGSGTFTYGAAYGFSGIYQVNINSGTVVLDGIDSATFINVNGGTLAGTGTLDFVPMVNINSGGTLAPGTPGGLGTLTIDGYLNFNAGSFYGIDIAPGAGNNSKTVETYGANLDGNGTVIVTPQLGRYSAMVYQILTTADNLHGAFAGLTVNGDFSGSIALDYATDPGDVDLDVSGASLLGTPSGANVNQQNVLNGINNGILASPANVPLPPQFVTLGSLSGPALLNALTQIDGEDATGAETSAFQLMTQFLNLLLDPSSDGGVGGGGPLGFAPNREAGLPPDIALAYASILKAPPPATFDQRWTSWGSAFGGGSTADGNAAIGSNNLTASDYGFAGGMDYHVDPATLYGFALAGGGTNWGLAQGLGSGRSDAFMAGLYGKHYFGPAYVSGALAFANHWFTTDRTALGDQLTANFQGQSYGARFEGGYRFGLPAPAAGVIAGVTPYAALQTQWFHTPAYSETDLSGGGFGLSYNSMSANDTRSELGARFDDLTVLDNMPLILRGRLAWAHDWVSDPALGAAFESLPGSAFTVNGAPIPQNSALASAGAELHITANWSALAKFDGEFAGGYQLYAGSGTLRYTW